jgi:hypothetical protein
MTDYHEAARIAITEALNRIRSEVHGASNVSETFESDAEWGLQQAKKIVTKAVEKYGLEPD